MSPTEFCPLAAAWLTCGVATQLVFLQVRQDRLQYARFKRLVRTEERQATYRAWLLQAWLHYTLLGTAGLLLLRRFDVLWAAPADFLRSLDGDLASLGIAPAAFASIGAGIAGGLLAGTLIACALPLVRRGRLQPPLLGDVEAMLPRNGAEARLCAALSLNAGIGEEIFFRALLPLAVWQITGHAGVAVLAASLLFALVHAYQGLTGIAATWLLGLLFALVYATTRQLWLAMLLHVLVDVRALLVTAWARSRQR